jgi:putative ABC transport system permease protein
MSRHLFKLAYRSLLKHPSFSLISLIGLATSLAATIVIFSHYIFELNFDKQIPDSERTYRIITRLGEGKFWARTFACYGEALGDRPEVEEFTTFMHITNTGLSVGENDFTIPESVIADTSFIDFFGTELTTGRGEDLGQPNTVFVTGELAERLFPGENPMGKEIFIRQFEGNAEDSIGYFTIAGIVRPLPGNTHFGFEMVCSQQGHFSELMNHLKETKAFGIQEYVRLFRGVPPAQLEAELTDLALPFLEGQPGPSVDAFNSKLQAVRDIHFTTDINRETRPVIRKSMIYLLLSIGLLIVILMTMNFTSAVIVQSQQQKKATGIMRTLGATKRDLFRLALLKNALIVGLSLLTSWFLIALSEPFLQSVLGPRWSVRLFSLPMLFAGPAIGIPVMIIATLGMRLPARKNFNVFGWLTVIQFAIVIILLGFSLVIGRQIRYLDQKDLGYVQENIYIVRIPAGQPRGSLLVEEIEKQAGVISASTAHHHPGDIFQSMEFTVGEKSYPFAFRMVDPGALETLEIELLERFGSPEGPLEGWVINETFYRQLLEDFSPEDVATSHFSSDEGEGEGEGDPDPDDSRTAFVIGGVMKDFHYSSLHDRIGNFAFVMRDSETNYNRWLMVRFTQGQDKAVRQAIDQMMDTHFPGRTFEFFLLEDQLKEQYAASNHLSKIIRLFTLLSVLIALSGLYGLSLHMTRRRSKEIGIRKIHGAGTRQITGMLNLGFLKWVGLAFIIACPLTFWALQKWLINFAYRTELPWWIFALPGVIVAGIAMMAVSWQTSAAARSNPVNTISMNN